MARRELFYRILCLVVVCCIGVFAQAQTLDSLLASYELSKHKTNDSVVQLLDSIVDKAIDDRNFIVASKYADIYKNTVKKVGGIQTEEYAKSLFYQGKINEKIGRYDKSYLYLEQSVFIYEKLQPSKDASKAFLNFGVVCYHLAMYKKALLWYEKSKDMLRNVMGSDNLEYAAIVNNIGVVYNDMGDFEHSLECYEQAAELTKQVLGETNSHYALLLTNIGVMYYNLGLYEKALLYYEKAKNFFEDNFVYRVMSLLNIGTAYYSLLEYDASLNYYDKALEICLSAQKQHPLEALCYDRIGLLYIKKGQQDSAFDYLKKALKLREKLLGKEHPEYAATVSRIGLNYYNQGDFSKALDYFEQALSIRKQIYGEYNQEYLNILNNIGNVYVAQKEFDKAVDCFVELMEVEKKRLVQSFSFLTEKERMQYWERNKAWCQKLNTIVYESPENTKAYKALYDAVLIEKGLLLMSEVEFRNSIQESDDSTLLSEYDQINMMRIVLEKQYAKQQDKRTINCDSLEKIVEEKEKFLIKQVKEYGDLSRALSMSWTDVRSTLTEKDLAIEFITTKFATDSVLFSALVLKRNMESPMYIPLFEKHTFEDRMKSDQILFDFELDSIRGFADSYKEQSEAYESTVMYEMVWKPLNPYFENVSRVYFSPSGMFHQVGIEYAPVSDTKIMSDLYEMHRVSSTKLLAMDNLKKKYTTCVLYGGIEYNTENSNGVGIRKPVSFLPGTKIEIAEIQSILRKNSSIKVSLYEGTAATEHSLKSLSKKGPSILHIATHGFFLDEKTNDLLDDGMNQSGLMMAGANSEWTNPGKQDSDENGIVTAKEISHIDLRKTDLVILSACQTALGKVGDEGVYGLQRGFKMAGVKTIIMSLWSVDDFATQMMMTEFYLHLTKGKSKKEAFSLAQAKVRKTYEDPFYWAGFILLD